MIAGKRRHAMPTRGDPASRLGGLSEGAPGMRGKQILIVAAIAIGVAVAYDQFKAHRAG
jgi:hypothetical protein